jgi:EF-hand domain pair/EF hand
MLRKLVVSLMALAVVAMMADDLLAQGRRGRRGAQRRQDARQERERNAEEDRLEREFGTRDEDEDDDRPLYRGAEFSDTDIRNGARGFIRDNDTDRDGKLSEHEFEGVVTTPIFGFLDRNRDGFLDADEVQIYMKEKMPADVAKKILDKETTKLMKRHDRDKDGTVDAEEFRGRDREFDEMDTNGDLKISEEEMRAFARREFEEKSGRLPSETTRFENPTGGRTVRDAERAEAEAERRARREEQQHRRRGGASGGDDDAEGDRDDPGSDDDGDDEPSSGR